MSRKTTQINFESTAVAPFLRERESVCAVLLDQPQPHQLGMPRTHLLLLNTPQSLKAFVAHDQDAALTTGGVCLVFRALLIVLACSLSQDAAIAHNIQRKHCFSQLAVAGFLLVTALVTRAVQTRSTVVTASSLRTR